MKDPDSPKPELRREEGSVKDVELPLGGQALQEVLESRLFSELFVGLKQY